MGRLDGKIAIITGAAGGMGRVAVDRFVAEGATVVACDLVEDRDGLVAAVTGKSLGFYRRTDVTQESDVRALVADTRDKYGRLDVLYNNHGLMVGKPFLETTMEEFDRLIEANLRSVFLTSLYAGREMANARHGSIINVSSVGGIVGFPGMAAYGASKGGVVQLTRSTATDLAPYGVRVNAICPGVIDTPMPRKYVENVADKETVWREMENMHLLKRLGTPEEVVWAAVFLASDEASFVTGAVIPVDGGLTAI
jgi:NAD(P)-dependent dehydrogenase (short-subunit alcohol dehydrogenase family)